MNFFAHAVVATWTDADAAHVLGNMVPDFEGMLRVPLLGVTDPDVQRGIDLHHQTDEVFHRAPRFVSLSAQALDDLAEAGVRRGTARAVGHIATEMFLDGCLAGEPNRVHPYLAALASDANERLQWEDGGADYASLRGRLRTWGAPRDYVDPDFVLQRLRDALRHRPALAILDSEADRVAQCLPSLQQRVQRSAPELLEEVRDALGFGD
jgi:acyl carrier protein phosphodiesterase